MNLSILLMDFIDRQGVIKTYRFVPINEYNKVVVDRIDDICMDVKGNTDKDIGLFRVYNSDKCQLISTTCKINDFASDKTGKISFCFEHMYIPVESSECGGIGIYNFVLPIGYKLTKLHIVDPFDDKNKNIEMKKHFRYNIFFDKTSGLQIVQMELLSKRGNFSFILKGEASINTNHDEYISYLEKKIYLDSDLHDFFFDEGIKKSFWQNLKDSLIFEPNFNGIGIDFRRLIKK